MLRIEKCQFWVLGSGFRVLGMGFGFGFNILGLGFGVLSLGCEIKGLDLGFRADPGTSTMVTSGMLKASQNRTNLPPEIEVFIDNLLVQSSK